MNLDKVEKNSNDFKLENNLSRARSKIFEYALCNQFDYFVTLTIDQKKLDRYNLDNYIKKLTRFIRYNREKYNVEIQYLLIPERHKDDAWHLHGLIKGLSDDMLKTNKNGYLDWEEYSKKFGYISLGKIRSQIGVSKYITKYISKNLGEGIEKEKKLYYCSRGLKKAKKTIQGQFPDDIHKNIKFDFINDYVSIISLNEKEYNNFLQIYNKSLDNIQNIL